MAIRPIVQLGDPRLRLKGLPVDSFGKFLHGLLDDMTATMRDAPGVGLAAPQVGEALQACVVEVGGNVYELMNPQIVKATGDERDLEGCLSLPGYYAYVTRREKVWVVAQNRYGKKIKVSGHRVPRPGVPARAGPPRRQALHRLPRVDGRADPGRPGRRRGCRGGREGPRVTDPRARVLFLGSGGFAVPILYRLGHMAEVDVVGVVSTPAKPAGRKGMLLPVPVASALPQAGLAALPAAADPRPRGNRGDPRPPA